MAATEKKNIWFHSSADGVAPEIKEYPIAATQGIFMPNAPCYLSKDGTIKRCDTSAGTGEAWHGLIVGVRNKDTAWPLTAALAVNTVVRVLWFAPGDLYALFVENNGTDSAVAVTDIGEEYGLVVSTTADEVGYTTLDLNEQAQIVVSMDNIMPNVEPSKHAVADSPGIAIVRILTTSIDATLA